MRIFIITMEDPLYTLPFIKEIINERQNDIVGIAVTNGDRLTIGKNRSKIAYVFSLLFIMGFISFFKNSIVTALYKVKKKSASVLSFFEDPGILKYACDRNIPTYKIQSPNKKEFLDQLRDLNIDVIINQSQNILKKDLLSIPKIGVINRHNALLPKNRGRLTPFWVLYKQEKETGVSIHFVNEGIDAGPIIVQEKYPVETKDNFNTLVDKNYKIAPHAIFKALNMLEIGENEYIVNDDELATYNSVPTLKDALSYRLMRIRKAFRQ